MPGWDFAHVHDDLNPHIVRMLEGTFSLDAAQFETTSQMKWLFSDK